MRNQSIKTEISPSLGSPDADQWLLNTDDACSRKNRIALSKGKLFMADAILLIAAFFLSNYMKRGNFGLPMGYLKLLFLFFACWFIASVVAKKYSPNQFGTYRSGIRTIVKSNCYLGYCISFIIVFFGYYMYSRVQVFSTCFLLLLLNVGAWSFAHRFQASQLEKLILQNISTHQHENKQPQLSYRIIAADIILLILSFFSVNFMKRGHLELLPQYEQLLLILIALCFFSGLVTKKYFVVVSGNVYTIFWQWEKAGFFMLASASVLVYGLSLFHYSRFQSIGTICMLMLIEGLFALFLFGGRSQTVAGIDIESAREVEQILDQEPYDLNIDIEEIRRTLFSPAKKKLEAKLMNFAPEILAFIGKNVDLDEILYFETAVEHGFSSIGRSVEPVPFRLYVNLNKLNDVRRVNQYFLDIHQNMLPGGCFVGYAHTIKTHYEWMHQKFPRPIFQLLYGVDFLIHRVIPKLPGINKLYFTITHGKNRIISRSELLGRLSFCGFDIVADTELDKRFWVIAKKVKKPSFQTNPTYGPLVTLNRVGHKGKIIKIYKFRTMHPYSEFLQKYVYDLNGLQDGGKMKDDFRLTRWGKTFRKLWIDELPMLYNWLKGDLKIVGVRPLSTHFLSLYDEELRQLRLQTRPGLIPPFYVDLPKTFEEICASEKKYLLAYMNNPIKTDLYYGVKALYNIFIKKARSG